ncbi:COBW domain-containing protein [Hirsutella rhossiliensis]|uniref:COBW domain-containing protein n=1 Tax=Hirsutella rhossiliensis TaxID=111463 RepID=A0A9P8MUK9_9HYPO|nr:COBW domain-containing protein [Hirsutella rhossiliensis]KAH0960521.1 COBW domain-containing protein [Hirsutella rhossiliensis]
MQTPANSSNTEPFPAVVDPFRPLDAEASANAAANGPAASSPLSRGLRRASKSFEQSDPPEGCFAAAGDLASSLLSGQAARQPGASSMGASAVQPPKPGDIALQQISRGPKSDVSTASQTTTALPGEPPGAAPFPNGYHFPPKHTLGESVKLGTLALYNYSLTPVGFLVTIYGLNVVAWGGMLFLLLCNASPAMCYPTCNDIESPRRKWVEYDSQILNALFCVTGFGLAPWRFRDLYFLLQYRLLKKERGLRQLAGIHRGWFRLANSDQLPVHLGPQNIHDESPQAVPQSAIPHPEKKIPDPPLTGMRAQATKVWKLDLVIWLMVWNTFFQCCLCGFMWGMDRFNRPSWATGLFVGLGCGVAAVGGIMMYREGRAVRSIEGIVVSEKDKERLKRDREQGIWHYNNIKAKEIGAKGSGGG